MNENYENNLMVELEETESFEPTELGGDTGKRNGAGLLGVGLAVVGGAVYLWKNKDKIKQKHIEKQIAKWEKKGYMVTKIQDSEEEVVEESFDPAEENENAEE